MPWITSASVEGDTVVLRCPDPDRRLRGVRLRQDVRIAADRLDLVRSQDDRVLTVPRPDVDRMEHAFELRHADGGSERVTDPATPSGCGAPSATSWTRASPEAGRRRSAAVAPRVFAGLYLEQQRSATRSSTRACDRLLVGTVRSTFPAHEHEQLVAHCRGLLGAWVQDAARVR